jgi:hypothetical protein
VNAYDWMQHVARAAEDAECSHDAFMCRECFYAMVKRSFETAQREARAEALEEAAAKAEEYATTGSSHKATVIAKAIRALAKDRP